MPHFSKRSKAILSTCHPLLQHLMSLAILKVDFSVVSGHRTQEEQEALVKAGKSHTMQSKHLTTPSLAVDIIPYPPISDPVKQAVYYGYIAGIIMSIADYTGIPITWGGSWKGFMDAGHYELNEEEPDEEY